MQAPHLEIQRPTRHFLPQDFTVSDWATLLPYYEQLVQRPLPTLDALQLWMRDVDELHSVLQEEAGWRYIRMTCNTQDQAALARYQDFVANISPQCAPYDNQLVRKYYDSPHRSALTASEYKILDKLAAKDIELYREENVPLLSQLDLKAQEYGAINAAMTVDYDGKTLTLQQAGAYLERTDRAVREQVWRLMSARTTQDRDKLHLLLDELIRLRTQVARNAGYDSYTDYKFKELGRFDYGRAECLQFHSAIEQVMTPLYAEVMQARQRKLGLASLRPWDLSVDTEGDKPLHPFDHSDQLAQGTIALFTRMRPELARMIRTLEHMGHLDLGSRIGKAPGGYNYPLNEIGIPFIFMNAVGTQADLTTMVHECGHAIHSVLTRQLPLGTFKNVPSEIAELASMSMELMTMDYWDEFYTDADELRRARIQQILRSLTILPWIACVDAFQTWLYDHPTHSHAQRNEQWLLLHQRFFGQVVDWSGLADDRAHRWQRQLHIYEVPFYYIEYGMAQLGALQVWRNYKQNPSKGLDAYLNGLRLGYTRPIGEVYAAAGVSFDFSAEMMTDLVAFVKQELLLLGY